MEELENCPFCNSEASLVRTKDGSGYWYGQCKNWNCGCRLFARPTRDEAAKFWNGAAPQEYIREAK